MAENRQTKTPLPSPETPPPVPAGRSELDRTPLPKEKPAPNISFNASKGGSKAELKVKQKEQPASPPPKDTAKVETSKSANVSETDTSKVDHSPAKLVLDMIDIHEKVPAPLDAGYSGVSTNEDSIFRANYYAEHTRDTPYSEYSSNLLPYYEALASGAREPGSKYLSKAAQKTSQRVVTGLAGERDYGLSVQAIEGLKERFNIASKSVKEWTGVDLGQVDAIKDTGTLHGLVLHGGLPIAAGLAGGMLAATVGAPAVVAGLGVGALVTVADAFLFVGADKEQLEERNSILSVVFPDLETIDVNKLEDASPFEKTMGILLAEAQDFATLFGVGKGLAAGARGTKKTWKRFFKDSLSPEAHMAILQESGENAIEAYTKGDPTVKSILRNEKVIQQLKNLDDHIQDIRELHHIKAKEEELARLKESFSSAEIPVIQPKEGVLGRASTKVQAMKPDLQRAIGRRVDEITRNPTDVSTYTSALKAVIRQMDDPDFISGTVRNVDSGKKAKTKVTELGATGGEELFENRQNWTSYNIASIYSLKAKASKGLIEAAKRGEVTDTLAEGAKKLDDAFNRYIEMTATKAAGDLVGQKIFRQLSESMTSLEQSIVRDTARLQNAAPGTWKFARQKKALEKKIRKHEIVLSRMQNINKRKPEVQAGAYRLLNLGLRSFVQHTLAQDAVVTATLANGVNLSADALQAVMRNPKGALYIGGDVIEGGMDAIRRTLSKDSWKALGDELRYGIPMSKQHRYDLEPLSKDSNFFWQAGTALSSSSTILLSMLDSGFQRIGNGINTRNALADVLAKLPDQTKDNKKLLNEYLTRMNDGDIPPEIVSAFVKRRQQLIYSQQYRAGAPEINHPVSNAAWKFHKIIEEARDIHLRTTAGKEAKDVLGYLLLSTGGLFSRVSANAIEASFRHTHLGSLTSLKYWQEVFPRIEDKSWYRRRSSGKFYDDFIVRKSLGTAGVMALAASITTEIGDKDQGKLPTGYAKTPNIGSRMMGYTDYVFIGGKKIKLDHLGRFGDGYRMITRAKEAIARATVSGGWDGLPDDGSRALVWLASEVASDTALFNNLVPLLSAISKDKGLDYADRKFEAGEFIPGTDLLLKMSRAVSGKTMVWDEALSLSTNFNTDVSYDHFGRPANKMPLTEMGIISDVASFTQFDHIMSFFSPPKSEYTKKDRAMHEFLLRTGAYNASSKWWYRDKNQQMVFAKQNAAFRNLRRTMKPIGRTFPAGGQGISYPVTYLERNALRGLVTFNPEIVEARWKEWYPAIEEAHKKNPKNPIFKLMLEKMGRNPKRNLDLIRSAVRPFIGKVSGPIDVTEELYKMAYGDLKKIKAGNQIKTIRDAIEKQAEAAADYQVLESMTPEGRQEFFTNLARKEVMLGFWDTLRKGVHLYTPPSVVERVLEDSTPQK